MNRKPKPIPESPKGRTVAEGEATESRSPEALRSEQIRGSGHRETVEAFVVAFILALLFRAFIAEAFVIPTGSMAPTLMGAHKDVACDRCGHPFPLGASLERRGPETDAVVVAGVCPNCRHANMLDLKDEPNHATFSGDRILVSKFAYTLSEPERWDVIVFKFPGNPKQNYIKRLVGLPEETLKIRHGDVYARPAGQEGARDVILRKPPEKLLAMRHVVHDTAYQSATLIDADYPARWQPWEAGGTSPVDGGWNVRRDGSGLTATLESQDGNPPRWLRYFHRWPSREQWRLAEEGRPLAEVDPYSGGLVTDFYAYDSAISVDAREVFRRRPSQNRGSRWRRLLGSGYSGGEFDPGYQSGGSLDQFRRLSLGAGDTGMEGTHWTGDLILEADIETSADSKTLTLELVEAGVLYRCQIDLPSGTAVLGIEEGDGENEGAAYPFVDAEGTEIAPSAMTDLRSGDRHEIRFSNCDDELLLWIDGSLITFDGPTTFDSRQFRPAAENFPRYGGPGHPLDASPIAVGVEGGSATIRHLRVDRDKYYIATKDCRNGVHDYDMSRLWSETGRNVSIREIQTTMRDPAAWAGFAGWAARRQVSYELDADQFFPMGDNSPESLDARCWAGAKGGGFFREAERDAYRWSDASYVPRDLLVGKALVIFWPHPWNSPVPFTPNIKRMQLIR